MINDNSRYYEYKEENVANVNRYLTNLAQIRILGEQEYYEFMKYDGLFGYLGNVFLGLDEIENDINKVILKVKSYTDSLGLTLSSEIKYSAE